MIIGHCTYQIKKGHRDDFYREAVECGFYEKSRKDKGNLYYNPYFLPDDPDKIFVAEAWEDAEALDSHNHSPQLKDLDIISEKYLEELTLEFYDGDMKIEKNVYPIDVLLGKDKSDL